MRPRLADRPMQQIREDEQSKDEVAGFLNLSLEAVARSVFREKKLARIIRRNLHKRGSFWSK